MKKQRIFNNFCHKSYYKKSYLHAYEDIHLKYMIEIVMKVMDRFVRGMIVHDSCPKLTELGKKYVRFA